MPGGAQMQALVFSAIAAGKGTLKLDYRQPWVKDQPPAKTFSIVDVPSMNFIMIDGQGNPNTSPVYSEAVQALYTGAYTLKFKIKKELGVDYPVMPAVPAGPDLSRYNIPELKKRLMEAGLPESVTNLFSDSDIIENARAMGLLDVKPEGKSEANPQEKPKAKAGAKGKKKGG